MRTNLISTKEDVIAFWFNEISPEAWFKKDRGFDEMLSARASLLVRRALNGQLDNWSKSTEGTVGLVIVLDQFTRNIFRGTPHAFSGDEMALVISLKAIDCDWFANLSSVFKHFLLMPLMHSEDIIVQNRSLPLFKSHTNERTYNYAIKHREIIARFGRFPHRNLILGRPSTEEEMIFLERPSSSF